MAYTPNSEDHGSPYKRQLKVMEKNDINLNISNPGEHKIILLHGQEPDQVFPSIIQLNGSIMAPKFWYEGKKKSGFGFDESNMHVIVDSSTKTITLHVEDNYEDRGAMITGQLIRDPCLTEFKINSPDSWTMKQLVSFLKRTKYWFSDKENHMEVMKKVQEFKAKVVRDLEKADDMKGNELYKYEQKVTSEFKVCFTLLIPVFKGLPQKTFMVEVLFDLTDRDVHFRLSSDELYEIELEYGEEVMRAAMKGLDSLTVINL